MAKVIAGLGLGIVGTIDGLSIYQMRNVAHPIVRRKGGPSKEKIRNDPNMELVRRSISEFSGRASAGGWIMKALTKQKPLADFNIAGMLTALMVPVQKRDTVGDLGQRSVRLSAYPSILHNFSLNKGTTFDNTVRFPVTYQFSKETASATVQVPELIPGISFFAPEKYPWFSVQVSLGVVPDVVFDAASGRYGVPHIGYHQIDRQLAVTDWYAVAEGAPATTLAVQYDQFPPDAHFTLVLSIGIQYGLQMGIDHIQRAKHAGCAKVLLAE